MYAMKRSVLFLGPAMLGAILCWSSMGLGFYRRMNANRCEADGWCNGAANNGFVCFGAASVFCAIPDDTALPKSSVLYAHVHGYDGSTDGSVYAYACATYKNSDGGGCGAGASTSYAGVGNYQLDIPSMTYWQGLYASDFGFVLVDVVGTGNSTVRGIWVSN